MRVGAYDFIVKPWTSEGWCRSVRRALRQGQLPGSEVAARASEMTGSDRGDADRTSAQMERVLTLVLRWRQRGRRPASTARRAPARSWSRAACTTSARRRGPSSPSTAAAMPEALVESELFGHERGAFTGAIAARIGKFEHANGGTLFLDEIGEHAAGLQAKLLRALQERAIERVGSNDELKVDVRVIAASKDDLEAAERRRALPRRSVLPARGRVHRAAAAARAARGHPAAGRALHAAGSGRTTAGADRGRQLARRADGPSVAGQRARAAQRGRSLRPRPARRRLSRMLGDGEPAGAAGTDGAHRARPDGRGLQEASRRCRRLPRPSAYRSRRSTTSFAGCISRRRSFGRTSEARSVCLVAVPVVDQRDQNVRDQEKCR